MTRKHDIRLFNLKQKISNFGKIFWNGQKINYYEDDLIGQKTQY